MSVYYYEVIVIVTFYYVCYSSLMSFEWIIQEIYDNVERNKLASIQHLQELSFCFVHIGNFLFLWVNSFLSETRFKVHNRIAVSFVLMAFCMVLLTCFCAFSSSSFVSYLIHNNLALYVLFVVYLQGGISSALFQPNIMFILQQLDASNYSCFLSIVSITLGFVIVSIAGYYIVCLGIPLYCVYLVCLFLLILSYFLYLIRVYRNYDTCNDELYNSFDNHTSRCNSIQVNDNHISYIKQKEEQQDNNNSNTTKQQQHNNNSNSTKQQQQEHKIGNNNTFLFAISDSDSDNSDDSHLYSNMQQKHGEQDKEYYLQNFESYERLIQLEEGQSSLIFSIKLIYLNCLLHFTSGLLTSLFSVTTIKYLYKSNNSSNISSSSSASSSSIYNGWIRFSSISIYIMAYNAGAYISIMFTKTLVYSRIKYVSHNKQCNLVFLCVVLLILYVMTFCFPQSNFLSSLFSGSSLGIIYVTSIDRIEQVIIKKNKLFCYCFWLSCFVFGLIIGINFDMVIASLLRSLFNDF